MIKKVINLGYEVPETGEPRIQLLDQNLVKTASNDIQEYWLKLKKDPNKAYIHVIAMTDSTRYGCNNNGDYFYGDDLRKYHPNFVKNAHIYLHHVNKDPKKSIGKPIYSFYNENMHRVELVLEVDKKNPMAAGIITKLKNGESTYVSMGVSVQKDICSICNHESRTRAEYCIHLKTQMGKILKDGRQVYAINPAPLNFFDISVVSRPADKTAWTLEKAASMNKQSQGHPQEQYINANSALQADYEEQVQGSIAGLSKLAEVVKYIDGDPIQLKEEDKDLALLRNVKEQGVKHLSYPTVDSEDLDGVSPGGTIRVIMANGAPPSLHEMAMASAKHTMGDAYTPDVLPQIMQMIPGAIRMMQTAPQEVVPRAMRIFNDCNDDERGWNFPQRLHRRIQPITIQRITIIKGMSPRGAMAKFATDFEMAATSSSPFVEITQGASPLRSWDNSFTHVIRSQTAGGLSDTLNVAGPNGEDFQATRHAILQAQGHNDVATIPKLLIGTALGAAALGALFVEPNMVKKLLASTALGVASLATLASTTNENTMGTKEGIPIPLNTLLTKKAQIGGTSTTMQKTAKYYAPILGAATPAAFGLDYLYNKHVKYRGQGDPRAYMGQAGRAAHTAGEKFWQHPLASMATGAVVGSTARSSAKLLLAGLKSGALKRSGKKVVDGVGEAAKKAGDPLA